LYIIFVWSYSNVLVLVFVKRIIIIFVSVFVNVAELTIVLGDEKHTYSICHLHEH